MIMDKNTTYRFGDFILEPNEHILRRANQQIHLRPKAFEILLYLVKRHGHLVRKKELLEGVWPDVIVTENTLSHGIDEVRQALQDNAQEPLFIRTVPRLGFKFIAKVEESFPSSDKVRSDEKKLPLSSYPRSKRITVVITTIFLLGLVTLVVLKLSEGRDNDINSIAVLPFINLNVDPEQDYFVDGMTEELTTNLARIKRLRVISRTSAMTYKNAKKSLPEIARELNVDAVIEGSVLKDSNRVRITVQLVNARRDQHLWVESYERNLDDILTLQTELAQAIAKEIRLELIPEQKKVSPVNPEAYIAYLRGRYFWNMRTPEGFEKAKQQFLTAISYDTNYAPAYAGLADTYSSLASYGLLQTNEASVKAKEYVTRALELDESLAEAHVSLSFNLSNAWDYSGARKELEHAIELNPNYATAHHWYAFNLINSGQIEEGIAEMKKAQQLSPLSLRIQVDLGRAFYFARKYNQAIEQYMQALEIDRNFAPAHSLLGLVYLEKGLYKKAIAKLQEGMKISKNQLSIWLGYAYAVAGQTDKAFDMLQKLRERWDKQQEGAIYIALIYIGLGKKEEAFEWLNKAYEKHETDLAFSLSVYPYWDTIRSDPRFTMLIRKIKSTN
jgi:TolB-like protein/DNA-binding winged helix-turn-helix (wHTH) protein/Tfp pilus assembly protein PilF